MDHGCNVGQCSSGLGGVHVSDEAVSSLVPLCLTSAASWTVTESVCSIVGELFGGVGDFPRIVKVMCRTRWLDG